MFTRFLRVNCNLLLFQKAKVFLPPLPPATFCKPLLPTTQIGRVEHAHGMFFVLFPVSNAGQYHILSSISLVLYSVLLSVQQCAFKHHLCIFAFFRHKMTPQPTIVVMNLLMGQSQNVCLIDELEGGVLASLHWWQQRVDAHTHKLSINCSCCFCNHHQADYPH